MKQLDLHCESKNTILFVYNFTVLAIAQFLHLWI